MNFWFFHNKQFNCANMFNKMNCIKGIKNYGSQMESSFANSVLQSLSCLDCIKQWHNQLSQLYFLQMNNYPSLTKQFFILLNYLYSGNLPDSFNTISQFNFEFSKLYNNKFMKNDPFHFLYYFLDLLHYENNYIINPNFNKQLLIFPDKNSMKNEFYMFNLFKNFLKLTQNSVI